MKFALKPTHLDSVVKLFPDSFKDERGCFTKLFAKSAFEKAGLLSTFTEEYISTSKRNVIRGLHFQLPPYDHTKLVHCLSGDIFDVVVDLRNNSPTYGEFETFLLSGNDTCLLYIPSGFAHGFAALSEMASVYYRTSSEYQPKADTGILWNSLPIPWPVDTPIISNRDQLFPAFNDFKSPFKYTEKVKR